VTPTSADIGAARRVLLATGAVVGDRYRVRRALAFGGMGVVYQVVSLLDRRPLAMKMLRPELLADPYWRRRFEREVEMLRRLGHPNLVQMVEALEHEGQPCMVMELISGRTLDRVGGGGALPARRALVLARQVLDGLAHAHAAGVIHRDLKPENIVVTTRRPLDTAVDHVKVLDFGVGKLGRSARLTRSGITHGTPEYMAPEQARRRAAVDHRADLYAVGVILVEMLTGRRPFDGRDAVEVMSRHAFQPAPHLSDLAPGAPFVTPPLEALVARALAKQPDDRFADAAAMRDALDHAFTSLDHLPA
jgi:eukaryotic-like serine/threonine-protein kinase